MLSLEGGKIFSQQYLVLNLSLYRQPNTASHNSVIRNPLDIVDNLDNNHSLQNIVCAHVCKLNNARFFHKNVIPRTDSHF